MLKEKSLGNELPEDLLAIIKRSLQLKKHLEENHTDQVAKRGLIIAESQIRSLASYYKRKGKLSSDWKYDPDKIKVQIS